MTVYSRGDIVLVGFVFSDESAKNFALPSSSALWGTTARGKKLLSPPSRATQDAVSSATISSLGGRGPGFSSRRW